MATEPDQPHVAEMKMLLEIRRAAEQLVNSIERPAGVIEELRRAERLSG